MSAASAGEVLFVVLLAMVFVFLMIALVVVVSMKSLSESMAASLKTLNELSRETQYAVANQAVKAASKATDQCLQVVGTNKLDETFNEELRQVVVLFADYIEARSWGWETPTKLARVERVRGEALDALGRYTRRVNNLRRNVPIDTTPAYVGRIGGQTVATVPPVGAPATVDAAKTDSPVIAEPSTVPPDIEALATEITALAEVLPDDNLRALVAGALDTTRYYFNQNLPESIAENFITYLEVIEELLRTYPKVIGRPTSVAADFDNTELLERLKTAIGEYLDFVSASSGAVVQATVRDMEEQMQRLASLRAATSFIKEDGTTNPTV